MNMIDSAAQTHHVHSNQTVNYPFDLTALEFSSKRVVPLLTDPIPFVPAPHHQISAARQEYEDPYMVSPGFASPFQPTVNTNFLDCGSSHARLPPFDNTSPRPTCLESQSLLPAHKDWEDIWGCFIAGPEQDQDVGLKTTEISSTISTDLNVPEFFNLFGFGDASSTTRPSPEAFEAIDPNDTDCSATLANAALLDDPAVHKSLSEILEEMEELIRNRSSCSNIETEPPVPTLAEGLEPPSPPSSTLPSTLPAISHANVPLRPSRTSSSMSNITNERLLAQRKKNWRKSSFNANLEVFNSCKHRARTLRRQSSLSTSGARSATPRPPAEAPPRMSYHPMMPTRATPYYPLLARPLPPSMPNYPPIFLVAPSPSLTPFPVFQNGTYILPAVPLTNVPATSAIAPASFSKQTEPSTHTPASCIVLKDAKGKNIFKCSDESCGKECKTRGDLKRHLMSRKHQLPLHRCHACGRVFQREDPLRRHWRTRPQYSAVVTSDGDGNGGDDNNLVGGYTDQDLNSIPSMDMSGMPMSLHMLAPY